jgi:exodeoxyribonuclease VII large subunit
VDRERRLLDALRSRPVLADPAGVLVGHAEQVDALRERARLAVLVGLRTAETDLAATRSRLTTLGPASTLARGYAVVQRVEPNGTAGVLRSVVDAPPGTHLRVRLVDGVVHAIVPAGCENSDRR